MRRLFALILLAAASWPVSAQSAPPFRVESAFDVVWAYPGQAVTYSVTAYSDTAREVTFDLPAFEGFWQADSRSFSGSATLGGKQYNTVIFQVSLYPQNAGDITVAPASAEFAETVFSAGAIRTGNEATLQVLELPPAPEGFSGLVGAVGAQFSASPAVVGIGEPIDVTLRLQGAANLAQLPPPEIILPDGWRIYPENRSSDTAFDGNVLTQTRTLRWRAIPDRAGRAALNLAPLTVFTLANGYETVEIAPIDFEILPGANGELSRESVTSAVAAFVPSAAAPQNSAGDVPPVFWLVAPLAAFGVVAGRAGLRRWAKYQAAARERNALKRATSRLRAAARSGGDLTAIESAVSGYFADHRWDLASRADAGDLLTAVESERYNPDGARQTETLARRAAHLLRRIEGGK